MKPEPYHIRETIEEFYRRLEHTLAINKHGDNAVIWGAAIGIGALLALIINLDKVANIVERVFLMGSVLALAASFTFAIAFRVFMFFLLDNDRNQNASMVDELRMEMWLEPAEQQQKWKEFIESKEMASMQRWESRLVITCRILGVAAAILLVAAVVSLSLGAYRAF